MNPSRCIVCLVSLAAISSAGGCDRRPHQGAHASPSGMANPVPAPSAPLGVADPVPPTPGSGVAPPGQPVRDLRVEVEFFLQLLPEVGIALSEAPATQPQPAIVGPEARREDRQ